MVGSIFSGSNQLTLEKNIEMGEAAEKYFDKYMVVKNAHLENSYLHGDIIAVLSSDEYSKLEKPKEMFPTYEIWEGTAVIGEGLGVVGFYM